MNMYAALENSKNLTYAEDSVTIRSARTEQNKEDLAALAMELSN